MCMCCDKCFLWKGEKWWLVTFPLGVRLYAVLTVSKVPNVTANFNILRS